MIMGWRHSVAPRFCKMQDQKSLTLHWCTFLGGSSDIFSCIFAHKGHQYYDCGEMPMHSPVIIHDAWPEIIDAPLMLISMREQGACRLPIYPLRLPILLVWMEATMQPCDCWKGKTINPWCSVGAHPWAHYRDILTVVGCSTIVPKIHTVFFGSQYTVSMY